jgi:uncharacterized protein YdcH (DUF465 family)
MIENWIGKLIDWWHTPSRFTKVSSAYWNEVHEQLNSKDREINKLKAETMKLKDELRWSGTCYQESLVRNKGLQERNGNLCRTITNFEGLITENAKLEDEIERLKAGPQQAEDTRSGFIAWRTRVHRLVNGRTACGLSVPSPDKVGPIGFYRRYNTSNQDYCLNCKKKDS